MEKQPVRILGAEQLRSMARAGGHEAWELQFEYVRWRRRAGLEPAAEQLNRWHQAMEEIGRAG